MTEQEFVAAYATRSGMTVEQIREWKVAVPASLDGPCDDPDCEGWHMVPRSLVEQDVRDGWRDPVTFALTWHEL